MSRSLSSFSSLENWTKTQSQALLDREADVSVVQGSRAQFVEHESCRTLCCGLRELICGGEPPETLPQPC